MSYSKHPEEDLRTAALYRVIRRDDCEKALKGIPNPEAFVEQAKRDHEAMEFIRNDNSFRRVGSETKVLWFDPRGTFHYRGSAFPALEDATDPAEAILKEKDARAIGLEVKDE